MTKLRVKIYWDKNLGGRWVENVYYAPQERNVRAATVDEKRF